MQAQPSKTRGQLLSASDKRKVFRHDEEIYLMCTISLMLMFQRDVERHVLFMSVVVKT